MNLYRLDYQLPHGRELAVSDLLGPTLIRSRRMAEDVGRQQAEAEGYRIKLTRIHGAGSLKVLGYFHPSGTFERSQA